MPNAVEAVNVRPAIVSLSALSINSHRRVFLGYPPGRSVSVCQHPVKSMGHPTKKGRQ